MLKFIKNNYLPRALWLHLLLLLCTNCLKVTAVCNTCNSITNLACVSPTQFQFCINGLPTGSATSCPRGYVCSTATTRICELSSGRNVVGDCTSCNTCDSTSTFACTGVRTYALCLGTSTPSDLSGSCDQYSVCSVDYAFICGNATQGVLPTCSLLENSETTTSTTVRTTTTSTTVVTSTPATTIVTNPVAFCQTIQRIGRFPVGNDLTTTCKEYVFCFVKNANWIGSLYYCPGATYFDTNTGYCTLNVPQRCISTTRKLLLRTNELDFN